MKNVVSITRGILFISIGLLILFLFFRLSLMTVLRLAGMPDVIVKQTNLYYGNDTSVIARDYVDENRYWVPLKEINPSFIDATISIEDKHFYNHNGFDYPRILGALIADIKAMKMVQGASTISQQLAKNLYLTSEKTWSRKFLEAVYTLRLEENQTKEQILESYVNTIYFGFGTYGVEAAAQYYFAKHANELNLAESAMLAGIPKGPALYSPFLNLEYAKKRQKLILHQMLKQEFISKKQYEQALLTPLKYNTKRKTKDITFAPYFIDAVKQQLGTLLTDSQVKQGGLRVYTTLNPKIQALAENKLTETLPSSNEIQGSILIQNPQNGHILGLVGGKSYEKSQFNRVTQAIRQPGSTIKPILYYGALEKGYTAATTLYSEKTTLQLGGYGDRYTPSNASRTYANRKITLLEALALSDNVYAVKTLQAIGEKDFQKTVASFGISTPIEKVASSALGSSPVKHVELTNAYSIIANGGKNVSPTLITRIEDYEGKILYESYNAKKATFNKSNLFILSDLMKGMFESDLNSYTSVTGQDLVTKIHHDYSGKTGSTKTDSWMVGFTPELVTSVWIGYDNNQSLHSNEYKYAKKIWVNLMESTLSSSEDKKQPIPKNLVAIKINPETGKRATKNCPIERTVYFTKSTVPQESCTLHKEEIKEEKMPIKESPFHFLNN